jgi:heptosyltransferase-1
VSAFLQPTDCDLSKIRRLLIVKPSSLGDIVHTLPAVQVLKASYPQILIDWVVNTEWTPLLDGHPDIDTVIPFPRKEMRGLAAPVKFWKWSGQLRERGYDLALDFQCLLRSAFIARRSGAPLIAGLSDAREGARFFYHRVAQVAADSHAADRYLALISALGIEIPEYIETRLPPGKNPRVDLPERFLLLHPFSRGDGKSLTPAQVALFCKEVAPRDVVIAGQWETPLTGLPENAKDLVNTTDLAELIYLMERADCTISVDSGPMHMAAAISDRVLGIHTWSDPTKVGPYRKSAHVWKNGHILSVQDWIKKRPEGVGELDDEAMVRIAEWVMALEN